MYTFKYNSYNTIIIYYKMKIKKKIIQLGNSDGVVIDKIVKDSLNLQRGDMVEFDIKKIEPFIPNKKKARRI